jgi:putative transposase
MPRKSRFSRHGEYFHVIIRGNNKANIFFTEDDRVYFYSLLKHGVEKYKYKIHAFCLMTNHVHIALQVGDIVISKLMHNITFIYAKWINRLQERVGHVFQGRFKSIFKEITR